MQFPKKHRPALIASLILALLTAVTPLTGLTQTEIPQRKNKYSPSDDVKLGRQAAGEIEQKLRIVRDRMTSDYLHRVGSDLVQAIPEQFQHSEFQYDFKVVDAKEINAFALPGGPMYVHTGMIVAAKREGEMAGVMAHEIAHVALRHGTAQATKAAPYQTLGALGQIGGAILGGAAGSILGGASQMGVGVYLLKFSREYETEADILGAQILARAGYDPRDLAEMFKTIQAQGGSGGPPFLSSHPNPTNRYQRIEEEARLLRIERRSRDAREFEEIKARILSRGGGSYDERTDGRPTLGEGRGPAGGFGRVEPPSQRFRTFAANEGFSIGVPENWTDLPAQNAIWFAPEGGYGELGGQQVFTHGVNVGFTQSEARSLSQATSEFIRALQQSNRNLRARGPSRQGTLAGRAAYYSGFTNVSEANGQQESVDILTVRLRNGELFYLITVAPQREVANYQRLFQRISSSLQIRE